MDESTMIIIVIYILCFSVQIFLCYFICSQRIFTVEFVSKYIIHTNCVSNTLDMLIVNISFVMKYRIYILATVSILFLFL